MSQLRPSSLALLSIERERSANIDMESAINESATLELENPQSLASTNE